MKLISVIYKFRNIIKNYRKYNKDIIYDKYFVKLIDDMIYDLLTINIVRDLISGHLENLLLEYYPNQMDFSIKESNYIEDLCLLSTIEFLDNNCKFNTYLTLINDFIYGDTDLTENQKDKMNYIIFKKYIR